MCRYIYNHIWIDIDKCVIHLYIVPCLPQGILGPWQMVSATSWIIVTIAVLGEFTYCVFKTPFPYHLHCCTESQTFFMSEMVTLITCISWLFNAWIFFIWVVFYSKVNVKINLMYMLFQLVPQLFLAVIIKKAVNLAGLQITGNNSWFYIYTA